MSVQNAEEAVTVTMKDRPTSAKKMDAWETGFFTTGKLCGGSSFCHHGKTSFYCVECGGKEYKLILRMCEHGRKRIACKECKGESKGTVSKLWRVEHF
jgi:hypothetical protein